MQIAATPSTFQSGAQGIQVGQTNATKAAKDVVSATVTAPSEKASQSEPSKVPGAEQKDLATSLADLDQGERQVQASAKVVEAGDRTLGTLIDLKA